MTPQRADPAGAKIFVLEDEPDIARLICASLSEYGFHCEHLATGRQLLARARQAAPELCIVDLGLPDMDGMQVVRELQDGSPCAVLILTGRNDVTDRVLGLELGADDYIVKPFEPRELVARVRSILRRYQRAPPAEAATSASSRASPAGASMPAATRSPPPTAARSRCRPPRPACSPPCCGGRTRSCRASSCSANATSTPSTAASTCASRACAASSTTIRTTRG